MKFLRYLYKLFLETVLGIFLLIITLGFLNII